MRISFAILLSIFSLSVLAAHPRQLNCSIKQPERFDFMFSTEEETVDSWNYAYGSEPPYNPAQGTAHYKKEKTIYRCNQGYTCTFEDGTGFVCSK